MLRKTEEKFKNPNHKVGGSVEIGICRLKNIPTYHLRLDQPRSVRQLDTRLLVLRHK